MKVSFSDFTTNKDVFNYIVDNSKKNIIKVESRLLDEDGVVVESSDDFLENCGDLKFYFDDDESLEINPLNSVAIFVRGNGEKKIFDYVQDNDFEPSFINQINDELGLSFQVNMKAFSLQIDGNLPRDKYKLFKKSLEDLCENYSLEIK